MIRIGSQPWKTAALIALAVWLAPAVARADAASIQMDVNPTEIVPGDTATVTVTVTNAPNASLKNFSFGGLQVVGGPSENQQQTVMIGGGGTTVQSSVIYTWQVTTQQEGHYTIGPAVIDFGSQRLSSQSAGLTCSKNAAAQPRRRQNGGFFGLNPFDPFDQFDAFSSQVRRPPGSNDVFLKATIDKTKPYLGEQVTLSLYLFALADVSGVNSVEFPKLDGFWAEDTDAPTQLRGQLRTIDNEVYHVYLLRRRALFPLHAGKIVIDPVEAQISLALGIDPFSGGEQVKRKSTPIEVDVQPLPSEGQPSDFQTANVGTFDLSASMTPSAGALGQPLSVKVFLSGYGNIKGIEVPKPKLPDGLRTYDPTITDQVRISQNRYGGTRTIEWMIIPERTGTFQIPSIQLPYFDPGAGQYKIAQTQPISLNVSGPASAATTMPGQLAAPTANNVLDSGIRPIRLQGDLTATAKPVWRRGFFWPMAIIPVLLFGLLWGGTAATKAWKDRDPEQLRIRRAHSAASRRLKNARERLDANDAGAFYAEITRALQQFVTDKTGVGALGLTREELGKALADRGFTAGHVMRLVKLLETCETARFSPGAASSASMSGVLDQSRQLLDELERVRTTSRAA